MKFIREPATDYHAQRENYLTSHSLLDFKRCPQFYRRKTLGVAPDLDSQAYKIGRACHVLALEGRERFENEYTVGGPINPKTGEPYGSRTKAFAEWVAKQDREVLSDDEALLVEQMAGSVASHKKACELLQHGEPELVLRAEYCGLPCQVRMDWCDGDQHRIADLKTTENLDYFFYRNQSGHVAGDIIKYGYDYQAAFYSAIYFRVFHEKPEWYWIATEKREPFRTGMFAWTDTTWAVHCVAEIMHLIQQMRECAEEDYWPTGYEEVQPVRR